MFKVRFFSVVTLAIVLNGLLTGPAFAGFGFGSDAAGKSGLDFARGYDVNTVTTVTGRVVSSPQAGEKEHIFVDVKAGGEIISLNLGPKSFWEKKEIPLHPNDDITAKGSKAQGKDGKTYLMVQKLTNKTTGSQTALRNDQGRAAWSGWNSGGMMQGGGMMRGGGGMMRR
ncbi:DNA-binding protein [Geobacter sp. FeAm09]|uniref:DNA-binding protein n=1 Tax=Geobacter sp. FeAm09 TaxID=2597769 RepID=UPI0011ED5F8E|nr:DNA-binding protein [Geobacter sp. FeAm09]QEM68066.1 DNA-binding protein [Geobacter sp. FeAm09]